MQEREELAAQGLVKVNGVIQRVSKQPKTKAQRKEEKKVYSRMMKINLQEVLSANATTTTKTPAAKQNKPISNGKFKCSFCDAEFKSRYSLDQHKKAKKHDPKYFSYRRGEDAPKPISITYASPIEQEAPVAKATYFNKEAYQLAIRSMSVTEASRIAKDEAKAIAFLAPESPVEAVTEASNPYSELEERYKPTAAGEAIKARAKQEREARNASDVEEVAAFAIREVKTRTNQNDFAKRVAANFKGVCAITGSGEALEAAHIEPISSGNNNTSNGVLLLASLHRLFDAGLMAIHPEALTVHFSKDCTWFAKDMFEGKEIKPHAIQLNKAGLQTIWENFNKNSCLHL